jgi:hypothetical protein
MPEILPETVIQSTSCAEPGTVEQIKRAVIDFANKVDWKKDR